MKAGSGRITARWRADARLLELEKSFLLTGIAIQSSKSPTTIVGYRLSGKSRIRLAMGDIVKCSAQ
jgi:hypothetical protein